MMLTANMKSALPSPSTSPPPDLGVFGGEALDLGKLAGLTEEFLDNYKGLVTQSPGIGVDVRQVDHIDALLEIGNEIEVVFRAASDKVRKVGKMKGVGFTPAGHHVPLGAAGEIVLATAAEQGIVATIAIEPVVASRP